MKCFLINKNRVIYIQTVFLFSPLNVFILNIVTTLLAIIRSNNLSHSTSNDSKNVKHTANIFDVLLLQPAIMVAFDPLRYDANSSAGCMDCEEDVPVWLMKKPQCLSLQLLL